MVSEERFSGDDLSAPLVFRAAGRDRFELPFSEAFIASLLTLIYFGNGGYGQFAQTGGALADAGAALLLAAFWGVALVHLYRALRYEVRLDAEEVTVFDGFFRRTLNWNEAFIAEWRNTSARSAPVEIRGAAGDVKMYLDSTLLRPYRETLAQTLNDRLRAHRE